MSRIGKKPVAVPAGVTAKVDGQTVDGEGPEGRAEVRRCPTTSTVEDRRAMPSRSTPRDEAKRARAMWGMSRTLVANLVDGVTKGFEQEARDQRRRLPRGGAGQEPAARARLQPRRRSIRSRRASRSRRRSRPRSSSTGIDKRRSARSPPRSAASAARALQGQGREIRGRVHLPQGRQEEVRGGAMATDDQALTDAPQGARSPSRSARAHERARRGCPSSARRRRSMPRSSTTRRARRWPPPRSLEKDLRETLKTGADIDAAKAVGKLIAERAPRRPASRRWSSTAAATSITGASRRSPTAPARAV